MRSIQGHIPDGGGKEFLLIAVISLLLVSVLFFRTDIMTYQHPDFVKSWDHHEYIRMAKGDFLEFKVAPYCWRVLNPLIAKVLPFELQLNFLIISFISICMSGVVIYYLVKMFNFSKLFALMGMFMYYSLGWATKFVLYDFWLPDPLSFLFILLAIYYVLTKKDLLFMILLSVGVLVKESVIFTAPLYYTFNVRKLVDMKMAKRVLILVLPAIIVLLVLRILIPGAEVNSSEQSLIKEIEGTARSENGSYGYLDHWKKIGWERIRGFSPFKIFYVGLVTFGVMLIALPFFSIKRNFNLFLKFMPFLLLICSQLFFATNTERLLVVGFPAVILLALNGIDAISEKLRIKPHYFLLLPLFIFGLNLLNPESFYPPLEFQAIVFILYLVLIFIVRTSRVNYRFL